MSNCKYCGQWAGIFFSEHPLCREAINAGQPLPPDRRPKEIDDSNEMTVVTVPKPFEKAVLGGESLAKASSKPFTLPLSDLEKNELAALVAALAVIAENHPATVAESIEHWFFNHGWIKTEYSGSENSLANDNELGNLSNLSDDVRLTSIQNQLGSISKESHHQKAPTDQLRKNMSKLAIFWVVMFPLSGALAFLVILAFNGTPLQLLSVWAICCGICAVVLNLKSER